MPSSTRSRRSTSSARRFPDSRGPRYKLRGQVRERVARGKVTDRDRQAARRRASSARSASAKINSKGRFTKKVHASSELRASLPHPLHVPAARASWPPAASPSSITDQQASSSSGRGQLCGPAGASPWGAGSITRSHCTILWWRMRNAVKASLPTPVPHSPGPGPLGQHGSVATTNAPVSTRRSLNRRAARERAVEEVGRRRGLSSRIGERAVGDDSPAAPSSATPLLTWPWRSASVQPLMTLTSAFEGRVALLGAGVAVADVLGRRWRRGLPSSHRHHRRSGRARDRRADTSTGA